MYLNGNRIGSGMADEVGSVWQYLKKGDEIWLQIDNLSTGTNLIGGWYTHFSGYLVEE